MLLWKNFVVILVQGKKNTKKIWWSSEHPVASGRQQKCDKVFGRISCLAPNSRY